MNPIPPGEEALFQAAAARSGLERAAFLDRECAGDPALRARLEALVAAHEQSDGVLGCHTGANRPTISLELAELPDPAVGMTIGRYKLLEKLGEGGCGVVYVAEQTEPVRRRVALKVIKLGMDTREVIARFEAERQALAQMDHPNIARILDGGVVGEKSEGRRTKEEGEATRQSADSLLPASFSLHTSGHGRPYFVMELVRGIRITDYCDRHNLNIQDRLDLCIKVCQAIQHAHQKGIIHRDVKPSNILVTLHDGVPVPKVIDFGIAKATQGKLTDATVYTQLHQFIGTPAYMSPEQAELSGLDIDTRSDIYSLGVLLYELLTGATPFDAKELLASGIDAMRKTIREQEPLRPSTRLRQSTLAAGRADDQRLTSHVSSPPKSPIANRKSQVHSDLDWIVMKCLEKDRTRRYETANGLAADLKRHLNSEPVVARPASAAYRFQKTIRRNKLVFTAGMIATLALGVGLGLSLWQWRAAVRAGRLAEQRARAEQQARQEATREQENAREALARAATLLRQLETQKADELLLAGKPAEALAYLARALRENLGNTALAERAISVLSHFSFAWPRVNVNTQEILRFSPNGRQFLTVSENAAQLWETETGQTAAWALRHPSRIQHAEFSPDGQRIVTASASPAQNGVHAVNLQIYDAATGQPLGTTITSTNGYLNSVQFSPDARWLMAAGQQAVLTWDAESGQPRHQLPRLEQDQLFRSARFSPDTQRILTTSAHGIQVWAASTGQLQATFSDVKPNLVVAGGVQFSPDAARWLTRSERTVRTYEVATGRLLAEISTGQPITLVEFSPDGQRLLTVSADRSVRIWDSGTGQSAGPSFRHEVPVSLAKFSPHGQWVLTLCRDATVRVWDALDGHLLIGGFSASPPVYQIRRAASFSPDGRFVAINSTPDHLVWELSIAPLELGRISEGNPAGAMVDRDVATRSPAALGLAPAWFPELIEALAGLRLTSRGTLQPVPFADRQEAKAHALASPEQDVYGRVARWLVGERSRRVVSPFSTMTVETHVQALIRCDSLGSLREALRLSPASSLAMSRLAVHLAAQDPLRHPRRTAEAEYFSRQSLELAPHEPEVWLARVRVLTTLDRATDALQVIEKAIERFPGNAALWNQGGELLERGAQYEQAEQAYSRAIELTQKESAAFTDRRAHYLLNRSDARERQGHSEAALADRLAGLQWRRPLQREDSPHWGGNDPGRNMFAPATGLPSSFDLDRFWLDTDDLDLRRSRGVRFVLPLGSQSYESPAIARGRIFVGTNNDSSRDPRHEGDRGILMCFDEKTGEFLWQLVIPKLKSGKVNDWESLGLLCTPTVEGNRVYLVTTRCEVLCLTTDGLAKGNVGPFTEERSYAAGSENPEVEPGPQDADIVWRYDMMDELNVFPHNGTRSHALIVGDLLYVGTCNGTDWTHVNIPSPHSPSLIALNKHTGELMAEDDAGIGPRIFHGQWSSPSTGRIGERQLIFYGGGDGVCYAFDAVPVTENNQRLLKKVWWADCNPPEYRTRDGKPIRYPAAEGPSEILATPVFWRNRVYVAIGQEPEHGEGLGNLVCLDATREGDITETGILWSYRGIHRSMSTAAITPDGLLFIADFSGFVHCLDAETGRPYWVHDMKAHIWGSTLVADGKVYVGDEDGDFVVFAANREKQVLSSTFQDGQPVDGPNLGASIYSTPVVANGVVYFNSMSHLFAIEEPSRWTGTSSRPVGRDRLGSYRDVASVGWKAP